MKRKAPAPSVDWPEVIGNNAPLWISAYQRLEQDIGQLPRWQRIAGRFAWFMGIPAMLEREISEVSKFLGVNRDVVWAAQLVYDEGWAAGLLQPCFGCTSVSSDQGFGRNLDYHYPENASDYIYHQNIRVGDTQIHIEGFAGLLGWLAFSGTTAAASFNQAPNKRPIRRSKCPALFRFREFCHHLETSSARELDDEGDCWANPAASDFLLHFAKWKRRFIGEFHDSQWVWARQKGKSVQANTYQLLDIDAGPEWNEDSDWRMETARDGRSIVESLRRTAHDGTVDTVMLRPQFRPVSLP